VKKQNLTQQKQTRHEKGQKHAKNKPKAKENLNQQLTLRTASVRITVHNTAQNSSDKFPSCPPDNHHCSVR